MRWWRCTGTRLALAAACKGRGGRSAGFGVAKITMANKPEDESFVWATMYVGQAGRLTMGVHGNERGAVATKERGLKREADLGIADARERYPIYCLSFFPPSATFPYSSKGSLVKSF